MVLPASLYQHFASHHGIASRTDLLEHGLTRRRVDALLRNGTFEPVHRGVYRLAGSVVTSLQRAAAACAFDERVIVALTAAGRLWRWRKMGDDEVVVLVPGISSPLLPGVTVHRCHRIDRAHWIEREDGIRVTTPSRTIFDLARVLSDTALESVIEQALDRHMTTIPRLYAIGRGLRESGREGSARFGRVLDSRPAWRAPVGSDLELRVERALVARGLPAAQRQVPIRLRDGTTVRPDLYWPELGLAVEVDHVTWHGGRSAAQRDKWRDRQLRRVGVETIRVTDEDVRERFASAVRDIADEVSTRLEGTGTTETVVADRQNGESD